MVYCKFKECTYDNLINILTEIIDFYLAVFFFFFLSEKFTKIKNI